MPREKEPIMPSENEEETPEENIKAEKKEILEDLEKEVEGYRQELKEWENAYSGKREDQAMTPEVGQKYLDKIMNLRQMIEQREQDQVRAKEQYEQLEQKKAA